MPRVLFVSTSTTVGGAEKTLFSLATLLNPQRFDVAGVVSLKPAGAYAERMKAGGIKTQTLNLSGRPGFRALDELCKVIKHERPDIVHAVMYQAIQLCRLAKSRVGGFRLITSPRVNYRTRSAFTLLVDSVLKGQDDLLIAESRASRDYLIKRLGYKSDKVSVIYNGVDLAGWPASRLERQKKRLELRLGAEDVLLGAVGRLDAQKGFSFLIDAMARLKKNFKCRLVILGEGPLRPALEKQIRRHHLEGRVMLLGERSDVTSWLSALEIFVLPSLWEGLPNSLLEAMALGLPCVASNVDGVPEVIKHQESGLLTPPASSAALAECLARLIADAELRALYGAAAKERIGRDFSLIGMMAAYEAAYSDVLSRDIR
jgi:glycosyltransferase involved in cell wall biosynthesis